LQCTVDALPRFFSIYHPLFFVDGCFYRFLPDPTRGGSFVRESIFILKNSRLLCNS
jgi:hypothetical protein